MKKQYKNLEETYSKKVLKESVTPERLAQIFKVRADNYEHTDRVVIQTHYGDEPLKVMEVWAHKGTIYISVDTPDQIQGLFDNNT